MQCTHNIDKHWLIADDICDAGIEPDIIHINCTTFFRGNVAPLMSCGIRNDTRLRISSSSSLEKEDHIVNNFTFKANRTMDDSQLTCVIDVSSKEVSPEVLGNISWTSPKIEIICKLIILLIRTLYT